MLESFPVGSVGIIEGRSVSVRPGYRPAVDVVGEARYFFERVRDTGEKPSQVIGEACRRTGRIRQGR